MCDLPRASGRDVERSTVLVMFVSTVRRAAHAQEELEDPVLNAVQAVRRARYAPIFFERLWLHDHFGGARVPKHGHAVRVGVLAPAGEELGSLKYALDAITAAGRRTGQPNSVKVGAWAEGTGRHTLLSPRALRWRQVECAEH